MHKNEPKQESNQTTLARVKKEMDEPRMAESTREKDVTKTTRQKLGKAAVVKRENKSGAAHAQGVPEGEK
jgi:hypothetical protein